ncbi:sulfatase-like hydrolase/transferase [Methylophaga sulfidovorans]|uniref:Phosphoglycerol transferase MdoB n=1 Tax=Methylophaga sulfidovorans TaxID=45496 RepID=A0A1I4BXN4_9GAMM|nr:sulfatase-like hydrolase/transferase [Methylophaga sulfidovorans]SFK72927.1 hypothetical protein SAMN04488079_1223 [Methylophaga sulfidovorans]
MLNYTRQIRLFFTLSYLILFSIICLFWPYARTDGDWLHLYLFISSAIYALLYLLPALLITKLIALIAIFNRKYEKKWLSVSKNIAWILTSVIFLALYADYEIYTLYEYHFNGFVWNLIITPGGIEALGATMSTKVTIALEVIAIIILTLGLMWLCGKLASRNSITVSKRIYITLLVTLLLVAPLEEGVYAYSVYTGKDDLIRVSSVIPFHLKSSAHSFFKKMGVEQSGLKKLRLAQGKINYPLETIQTKQLATYPNIIMLVAESFRWDLLDPEITPNLWKFSQKSLTFDNHYSGGNRTRMGLLSMFYGVDAPYWYGFQQQKISPVLMNVLRDKGYQFDLHTSQSFDYPELRDTVFHNMPESVMEELKEGEPWARDHENISHIINNINGRNKSQPYYSFMFFESTHAPYAFPESMAIRKDYLKDMNYADLNLRDNIQQIHNRYINAAHTVDAEVGRLLNYLEENKLLDNTIVLFTGDHGEEFMENGHWGHGHNEMFPEQQIHVPLILSIPGTKPEHIQHKTSHIQIPATLMEKLDVTTDSDKYALAGDLNSTLPYLVAGNYNYLSVIDDKHKITFPFTSTDYFHYTVFTRDDKSVNADEKQKVIKQMQPLIDAVAEDCQRFISH